MMQNIVKKSIVAVLIIVAIAFISQVNLKYFTFNKKSCVDRLLTPKKSFDREVYEKNPYSEINCSNLTGDSPNEAYPSALSAYVTKDNNNEVPTEYVLTQRDYCEVVHFVRTRVETDVKLNCSRPTLFKQ